MVRLRKSISFNDEVKQEKMIWDHLEKVDNISDYVKSLIFKDISKGGKFTSNTTPVKKQNRHGMRNTRFYAAWVSMNARCYYKKGKFYDRYGGRGIVVCERWRDFMNFKDDMYESYLKHVEEFGEKRTTLDRIDNDGNYEKGNCRWATYEVQNNNR